MKNFIALYDQEHNFDEIEILKELNPLTKVNSTKITFRVLEKVFEWEPGIFEK